MDIRNSVDLPYSRQIVWDGLNNPDILRVCIPGCESFDQSTSNCFNVVAVLKVGMIKTRFEGEIKLDDINEPNSYRIAGMGKGGIAGYASGSAHVWLVETVDGTCLNYEVKADVGGKIAQLGSRLIDIMSNQMTNQFFDSFKTALDQSQNIEGLAIKSNVSDHQIDVQSKSKNQVLIGKESKNDWLIPYFVGLVCGILIGGLAIMTIG
ncbi:MAG: carbon monoxide dehydrogenase subunit G [Aestuariivita sp.]|nr:carbon monoxide dehydrogenase subunit G [Aestuariivita sp.]